MSKYLLIGVIVLVIVTFIVYYIWKEDITEVDTIPNSISLNTSTILMNSDQVQEMILQPSGSSILGLIYIQFSNKTQNLHGNYISLLSVNSAWSFEILRHPTDIHKSTTRLNVTTLTTDGTKNEIISLPDLPLQKWIFLGILRDGRRFDVMYNEEIVASHRLENYPVIVASPLKIGDTNLIGNAVHVIVYPQRLNSIDVRKIYSGLVDGKGSPKTSVLSVIIPNVPSIPSLPSFSDTNEILSVKTPPENNLKEWKTSYA